MEKFDIERMHRDCLEWCKSPVWKPWQNDYKTVRIGTFCRIEDVTGNCKAVLHDRLVSENTLTTLEFAHLIGLDVESYRKEAEPEKPARVKPSPEVAAQMIQWADAMEKEIDAQDLRTIRLECLKLAVANENGKNPIYQKQDAQIYFDWVMQAKTESVQETVNDVLRHLEVLMAEPPDAPKTPQADTQGPRKVLAENGWTSKDHPFVDLYEKGGIECWWSGDIWIITIGDKNVRWDGTAANLAELTAKPEQPAAEQEKPEPNAIYNNAAKVENAKEAQMEPINFLKSVLPFGDTIREAPKEYCQKLPIDSVAYFDWRGLIYKFNQETSIIDLAPKVGWISSNDASILMTALVKLAAKA